MKTIKKLASILTACAMIAALAMMTKVDAKAAAPVTWYITYGADQYYVSSTEMNWWTSLDYLEPNMKDGDNVLINGDNHATDMLTIELSKKIGELVVTGGASASVKAPYVERAYVAVNGVLVVIAPTVNVAEVYPEQTIQVNGNVNTFKAQYNDSIYDPSPVFAVTGTVGTAYVDYIGDRSTISTPIYNVVAGSFISNENGVVVFTKDSQYSKTKPSTTPSKNPGRQLDNVPKTGGHKDLFGAYALGIAAVFAVAGMLLKKNNK